MSGIIILNSYYFSFDKQKNMQQKVKQAMIFSGTITAIIVGVFSMAFITADASNRYTFSGRGIVSENDLNEKTLRVSFKQMSKQAESLVSGGEPVTVKVNQAKIFKLNAAGKLVKTTQNGIDTGIEVIVSGAVKSDNSFSASKVTINPRKFKMRGKLVAINKEQMKMTLEVSASDYRPTKSIGTVANITYTPRLIVTNNNGGTKKVEKLEAVNQRVVIDGTVTGDDLLEAVKINDPL
jgi:hypothetical protein